jgi:glycosyltransferase involved in cell wall biosynthesis
MIYLVSSALPAQVEGIVKMAKRRGAKLVWNQNGVAYPGCYGDFYPWFNRRMAVLRNQADFIVNQSEFSRISAERYLGCASVPSEILFNPVDTEAFCPLQQPLPDSPWRILAAGTSHALYRTQSSLDTLRVLLSRGHDVHLTIAGEFRWKDADKQVRESMRGLERRITILPPFGQEEAPEIYRAAHLLLHTKYNDPCPTVPIEAMACGLPVVGTRSGGMPELVPDSSGVLVPLDQGWTRDLAGNPKLLAGGVECVMENHVVMSEAARSHAVRTFQVGAWLERHREIFRDMTSR